MRRSAAPSQFVGQPSKRPRLGFTPPTLRTTPASQVLHTSQQVAPDKQVTERTTADVLKLITSAVKPVVTTSATACKISSDRNSNKENSDSSICPVDSSDCDSNTHDATRCETVAGPLRSSGTSGGRTSPPKTVSPSFQSPWEHQSGKTNFDTDLEPGNNNEETQDGALHERSSPHVVNESVEFDFLSADVSMPDHASLPSRTVADSDIVNGGTQVTCEDSESLMPSKHSDEVSTESPTNSSIPAAGGKPLNARSAFKSPVQAGKVTTAFKVPTKTKTTGHFTAPQPQSGASNSSAPPATGTEVKKSYYAVMWCKMSKKKHKKWEGDAILITSGRTASLLDMDGKSIGQSCGYKSSELASLTDGSSLCIGGKEIEVMGTLTEEMFKSGKCFQSAQCAQPEVPKPAQRPGRQLLAQGQPLLAFQGTPGKTGGDYIEEPLTTPAVAGMGSATAGFSWSNKKNRSILSKPFMNPNKSSSSTPNATPVRPAVPVTVAPRYDPSAPDALVMPRPSQAHQWQQNRAGLPIIDVVVDPYVSYHLRPHQRDGILFLYQCVMGFKNYGGQGVILADEMGLGKTLQSIALLWTLLRQGPYGGKPVIKRAIIITPGSLVKNWFKEFRKWLGQERISVYAVDADNKSEDYVKNPIQPVFIISYEMFVRNIDAIRKVNFDIILCDEGHRLKNNSIKTTTFVSSLNTRRRVILTGTPIQNDLQELFSLVDFCNPSILGTSSAFRHVYESPILASRQPDASEDVRQLGETRAAELNRITSMFILRRTQEINNKYLPPKAEMVIFCQPSSLQLSVYGALLHSRMVRSCLQAGAHNIAQHLMCISLLKKLCNHPTLLYKNTSKESNEEEIPKIQQREDSFNVTDFFPPDYDASAAKTDDSGKLFVLSQMLRAIHDAPSKQRVVLVSNYTQTLDVLEGLCTSEGYSFLRLDGQTPTSKRHKLVEQFNSPYGQHFVFLLSSKAGGVGLNLIGACRLILYDIDWNPANDLQAMARVWRDGQKQKVFIYRLLTTGSLEEKIYQRQISKQALSGVVVDLKTKTQSHFSPEELKDLFTLQTGTQCSTHDLLGCPCDGKTPVPVSQSTSIQRTCQLSSGTGTSPDKQTNICMDELFEWNHLAGPDPPLADADPILGDHKLEGATYIFWNESQQNCL